MVVYSKAHWEKDAKKKMRMKSGQRAIRFRFLAEPHLNHGPRFLTQRVVVLELDCHGLITVHSCHLYIRGVVHVDRTKEVCGSEAWRQTKMYINLSARRH